MVSISLQNVRKIFQSSRIVFTDLNLTIPAGDFVTVVGPSGCGKTTLLRILAGLEPISSGDVRMEPSPRIGFVFQEPQLLPWRTASSNVSLPLELEGKSDTGAVLEALAKVGMSEDKSLFPSQLSGGMKMRVSLARALVTKPTLLLLDEPFAALDELTRVQLEEDLRALWASTGITIVLVTHSFSEAVFISNRIVMLSRSGEIGDSLTVDLGKTRDGRVRGDGRFTALIHDCRSRFESLQRGAK